MSKLFCIFLAFGIAISILSVLQDVARPQYGHRQTETK